MKFTGLHKKIKHWIYTHWYKSIAIFAWILILLGFYYYKQWHGVNNIEIMKQLYFYIVENPWGPALYIFLYLIRAIILFPSSLMTLISGILFGPFWGIIYTLIGENFSANLGFFLGRRVTRGLVNPENQPIIRKIKEKITSDEFLSLILLRSIPIPFDFVNYSCGALKIKWKTFAGATAVGIIPGMVTFVLFGASLENIESFSVQEIGINSKFFTLGVIFYAITFLIAFFVRKYTKHRRIK